MTKFNNFLINKNTSCLPIWFMRQAGRYLPEFRKIRLENKDFIKLCLNSDLSSEITLQPLKRFDLDAAIIFSDILMVPYALGQKVNFEKGKGPILSDFNMDIFLNNDEVSFSRVLKPVYDAIRKTRSRLDKNKSLISFVGAPWTLVVYMLGLKNDRKTLNAGLFDSKIEDINSILKNLKNFLCLHIKNQIDAGADTVQIFDSWAGLIPEKNLQNMCYLPNLEIVDFCKENKIPVICFPKGIKKNYLNFSEIVRPDGISIDYDLNPHWVRDNIKETCIQGGPDPKILFLEESQIYKEVEKYLLAFKNCPYIFNLGHGLLPETNPDKVFKLIKFVRNYE